MFSNQMARRFMLMLAPKMQNHSTAYRKGKGHMTPCLMVHPREMRAMKTRGAQAIHLGALAVFRPLLSQCRVGKGCDVEGNRDEVVQVVTDRPNDQVEDVPGRIQCKCKHHHHVAAYQGAIRDCLDSQLQTCHDRKHGTDRDDGNQHRGSAGQLVLGPPSRLLATPLPRRAVAWGSGASGSRCCRLCSEPYIHTYIHT